MIKLLVLQKTNIYICKKFCWWGKNCSIWWKMKDWSQASAGRNKPGFDLLQKILRRFPRINPDWLLLDSDKIYRDEPPAQSSAPQPMSQPASPGGDLFGLASGRHPLEEKRQPETAENATGDPAPQQRLPAALFTANVKRIVVLYDDQTFESFTPTTMR